MESKATKQSEIKDGKLIIGSNTNDGLILLPGIVKRPVQFKVCS